jgi:hypothetical protein
MNESFPDDQNEAVYYIRRWVHVTSEHVHEAKRIIAETMKIQADSASLVTSVLARKAISPPAILAVDRSINSISDMKLIAAAFSWRLATAEAILSLVHSGDLVSMSEKPHIPQFAINFIVGPTEGSPTLVDKKLPEFEIPLPSRVRIAPSREFAKDRRPA